MTDHDVDTVSSGDEQPATPAAILKTKDKFNFLWARSFAHHKSSSSDFQSRTQQLRSPNEASFAFSNPSASSASSTPLGILNHTVVTPRTVLLANMHSEEQEEQQPEEQQHTEASDSAPWCTAFFKKRCKHRRASRDQQDTVPAFVVAAHKSLLTYGSKAATAKFVSSAFSADSATDNFKAPASDDNDGDNDEDGDGIMSKSLPALQQQAAPPTTPGCGENSTSEPARPGDAHLPNRPGWIKFDSALIQVPDSTPQVPCS